MPVINGFISSGFTHTDFAGGVSSNLNEYVKNFHPYSQSEYGALGGIKVTGGGLNSPVVKNGFLSRSYDQDWVDKIHIIPAFIDLGAITGDASSEVEILNTYRTSKNLTNVDDSSAQNLVITGISAPLTINPTQAIAFFVDTTPDTPGSIDAEFVFEFTPAIEGALLNIIGTKITTMPYMMNNETSEGFEWNTDIITSKNGSEQRRSLIINPRQMISTVAFINYLEYMYSSNLFDSWRDKIWAVPLFQEQQKVTSQVSATDVIISVNTDYADYRIDKLAIIWESARKFQTFEIESYDQNSITSKQQISQDYSARAIVCPVISCYMQSDPNIKFDGYNGSIKMSFKSIDNAKINSSLPNDYFSDGIETFEENPEGGFFIKKVKTDMDIIDFKTGKINVFSSWDVNKIDQEFNLMTEEKSTAWIMKQFLHRRFGRAIPFYMPSFQNDIRILNTSTIIAALNVEYNGHTAHGSNRSKIGFLTYSSGWVYASITAISDNGDGTESISLGSSVNLSPSDIKIASFVSLRRLTSDEVNIKRDANFISEFNFGMTEIKK